MSVNAIAPADLVSTLAQNVNQGTTPDLTGGVNVLKKALNLTQDNAAELISSESSASDSGSRLNVYG